MNAAERGSAPLTGTLLYDSLLLLEYLMASLTMLKFSSQDCGTCHQMSHDDAAVARELGWSL